MKGGALARPKNNGDEPVAQAEQQDLQHRVRIMQLQEANAAVEKAEKLRLRKLLAIELKPHKLNTLRIQTAYRKSKLAEKVEELKKEIEILSQNHERDVDKKDAIIQMLSRDLEEFEEQYQMALRSHLCVFACFCQYSYLSWKSPAGTDIVTSFRM